MTEVNHSSDELRELARTQRLLIISLFAQILSVLAVIVAYRFLAIWFISFLFAFSCCAVFAVILSSQINKKKFHLLGLFFFIPIVNIIPIYSLDSKATDILRSRGVSVGLIGANKESLELQLSKSGEVKEGLYYAGFWRRFAAMWIDLLVMVPLMAVSVYTATQSLYYWKLFLLPALCASVAYYIYFVGRWGATLGKMAMHIKVVGLQGEAISYRQAFYRHSVDTAFATILTVLLVFTIGRLNENIYFSFPWKARIDYLDSRKSTLEDWVEILQQIWIWSEFIVLLCNKQKRALHDYIAGTVVICTNPRRSSVQEIEYQKKRAQDSQLRADMENHRLWLESTGASGAQTNFISTDFKEWSLKGKRFDGANLSSSKFDWADLRGANFSNANLTGVSLLNAKMDANTLFAGANLSGARVDARDFNKGKVILTSVDKSKLPEELHHLWDKQNKQ